MATEALKQYLDLYDNNLKTLDKGAPEVMNQVRRDAREALEGKPLPRKGQEGYEQFSVEEAFAPDYGINLNRRAFDVDTSKILGCDIPKVSTWICATVNDLYTPSKRLTAGLPAGVTVCPFTSADPELLKKYYATLAKLEDPTTALNSMLAQDGILVHVAEGVCLERPVQIVNFFDAPIPMLAARRLLVVLEEGAQAQILVCDHSKHNTIEIDGKVQDVKYLSSQVTEVILKPNSKLGLYELEESTLSTTRVASLYAAQSQGSELTLNSTTLMGGKTRNNYRVDINGDHCDTRLSGMVIGSDQMVTDNSTYILHHGRHGHSDQLYKYILDQQASGAFEGIINVEEQAEFTSAYQSNRNLLASEQCRMHSKPQLEIYCEEVKCSHGATTGQLDQRALFYMRQRGIPLEQARTMLMQAFMADVIDTIQIEGLRERLRYLTERRLSGSETCGLSRTLCADCNPGIEALDSL